MSLINHHLNETYHSRLGAYKESMHVFIQQGLRRFLESNNTRSISILEVGYGTGLNAILSCEEAIIHQLSIRYEAIEKYPVPSDLLHGLSYADLSLENKEVVQLIHSANWESEVEICTHFSLFKRQSDILKTALNHAYDIIYFDAFAPSKQADLWHFDVLQKLVRSLKKNGLLVSYSAMGQFKRDLKSLGLIVTNPPGALGKREMTVACK